MQELPNNCWNIREFNKKQYLPYFNAFLVLYVFLNNLQLGVISKLGNWHFFIYIIGMGIIVFLSPIAWHKSTNLSVWLPRLIVLVAIIHVTFYSLNQTIYYLYLLQIVSITLWYRNRKEFFLTTLILTTSLLFICYFNFFVRPHIVQWGIFIVSFNFMLAYVLYKHSESQKELRKLYKIFNITLNNTNNAIQFVDVEGRTRLLNPAAENLYGYSHSEAQGKYDWKLFFQGEKFEKNGAYTSLITESLETGKVYKDVERIFVDENCEQKVYLVETFRVYDESEDKILGAMGIYRDITKQKEMERQLLDAHYEMANIAVTDELTKLYNVRYFRQRLTTEVAKAYKSCLSLLIIDIDYFKIYNDLFGHLAGDNVLRKMGTLLKESFRANDIVARYGGEEFTVILPGMNKETAKEIAERIRIKIKNMTVEGEEKLPGGKLTVTIGVASVPDDAKTAEELIKIADDALYRGKYGTRDIVATY